MTEPVAGSQAQQSPAPVLSDPRALLARWSNDEAEWVRFLVGEVLATAKAPSDTAIEQAYELFRQENGLDPRTLPGVPLLSTAVQQDQQTPPLSIVRISEVRGVNALIPDEVIEPHEGLTILFGENGTGNTGYARVLKALAGSRTADEVLGNISVGALERQHARIEYRLGGQNVFFEWTGQRAVTPLSRMAVFDGPSVTIHVDDALDYVFVPAALSLFDHATAAIKAVSTRIDAAMRVLNDNQTCSLSSFPKASSVYPSIETLGASTDLAALRAKADTGADADERLGRLQRVVAALESDALGPQIILLEREHRVAEATIRIADSLTRFEVDQYNSELEQLAHARADYAALREALFAQADLPATPDDTWSAFVESGEQYRRHLEFVGAAADDRCLYCRQPLGDKALGLISKYSEYLGDKLSLAIKNLERTLARRASDISNLDYREVSGYVAEFQDRDDAPSLVAEVGKLQASLDSTKRVVAARTKIDAEALRRGADLQEALAATLAEIESRLATLKQQNQGMDAALEEKRKKLSELTGAIELGRQWSVICSQVRAAKEAERLAKLKSELSLLLASVTRQAKTASDQLVNQSFGTLFAEECAALRAPELRVRFQGREGRAQRKKALDGHHAPSKPSKVLSEGEQKVIAMADFLAEARLSASTAPVVFDDPVSSLDHRRIDEVAQRISKLADDRQVIVFTHDIFFATTLLSKFEKSKRCSYFQISDERGKGQVRRATGPRWDTLRKIKAEINKAIEHAKQEDGDAKAASIADAYSRIRAWCEVFTEQELLQGVTQRYQPNVGMTRLSRMKPAVLADIIPIVVSIYEEASRYITAHSQPLVMLGVSPKLKELEEHWRQLQECKARHDNGAVN